MSSDCMASDATVSHYLVPLTEMSLGTKLTDKYRLKQISASIIKQLFYVFFLPFLFNKDRFNFKDIWI